MFALLQRLVRAMRVRETQPEGHSMSKQMRERMRAPAVNLDGTPMAGGHDIRGRGYGSGGGFGSSKY